MRGKVSTFDVFIWYKKLLIYNYPLQFAKTLSNIKRQLSKVKRQLCKHLLYESSVGQCEYTTQTMGSFWCHLIDTKSALLILIFTNEFVFIFFYLSFSFRTSRMKPRALRYWYFMGSYILVIYSNASQLT